jgi:hypothetical protein
MASRLATTSPAVRITAMLDVDHFDDNELLSDPVDDAELSTPR